VSRKVEEKVIYTTALLAQKFINFSTFQIQFLSDNSLDGLFRFSDPTMRQSFPISNAKKVIYIITTEMADLLVTNKLLYV